MPPVRRFILSAAASAGLLLVSGCAIGVPRAPTDITRTNATLNADVYTTFGGPVTYWFRYGKTTSYGSETPHRTIELAENSSQAVSEPLVTSIIGLSPGTEYHWQICARDTEEQPARLVCSGDRSFVTANVSCGQTITESISLTNDLHDCAGAGLIIGAPNITLDLNGHVIDGDLSFSSDGIRNPGFDGVIIEDGTVREFSGQAGVLIDGGVDNHVRGLEIHSILEDGIAVEGDSAGTLIEDSEVSAIGIALAIRASGVQVDDNVVSGVGRTASDKIGPLVVFGDDNRIEGNTARLTHVDGAGRGVGFGSLVVYGDRNQILGNTASDSVLNGIVVTSQAADTLVRDNLAERNGREFSFGDGILVENASTSLGGNSANFNASLGIRAPVGVSDLGGNTAEGNGDPAQCQNVVCQ